MAVRWASSPRLVRPAPGRFAVCELERGDVDAAYKMPHPSRMHIVGSQKRRLEGGWCGECHAMKADVERSEVVIKPIDVRDDPCPRQP